MKSVGIEIDDAAFDALYESVDQDRSGGLDVNELKETAESSKAEGVEALLEGAADIDDAVRSAVMKVVMSKASKTFKKSYKVFFSVKDHPSAVLGAAVKVCGPLPCETIVSDFLDSDDFKSIERLYALLAIAQSCLRPLREGENR